MRKKIVVDIGHGGKDPGASANGLVEKDVNLDVGLKVRDYLLNYDAEVKVTRETDITLGNDTRVNMINSFNPNLCVSIHHNAAASISARGAEVIHGHYDLQDDKLANDILSRLIEKGMPTRREFTKLNDKGEDWYFMIRRIWDNDTDSIIVEGGFLTNHLDAELLKTQFFLQKEADAIAGAIVGYLGLELNNRALTEIMGGTKAQAAQLISYAIRVNKVPSLPYCTIDELAKIFIEEGEIEGVRADVAWAQSLKETGYFRYGGIVLPEQNNYGGIGALNNNAKGVAAAFENPRLGVRAQIQHLKAYASTENLKQLGVDPRFELVKRGSARYVEWLGYKDNPNGAGWAWPGAGYGYDIAKLLNAILQEPIAEEHWGIKFIQNLKDLNLITGEHNPQDQVTWAEFASVITKLVNSEK